MQRGSQCRGLVECYGGTTCITGTPVTPAAILPPPDPPDAAASLAAANYGL